MALSGSVGAVYVQTSAAGVAFTDLATTAESGLKRYYITDRTKSYWDKTLAVTVKKNAVIQTSGFKIEYAGGFIEFDSALLGGDVVVVSATALTVSQVAGFFNWKLDVSTDMVDATTFADGGWKQFIPVVKGFGGSAEQFWADSTFLTNLGSADMIVVLYVDVVNKLKYEGYVKFSKDGLGATPADLLVEGIDFQGSGDLYYHTV